MPFSSTTVRASDATSRRMVADLAAELGAQRVLETHISWVLLTEAEAIKIKKPVKLPYLDFSAPERRVRACKAELEVNRRLAPRTYLGLSPIRQLADGRFTCNSPAGGGEVVEQAVRMVRLPDSRRADLLLAAGALSLDLVDLIAEEVASFHADAPSSPRIASAATPSAIEQNVRDNFRVLDEVFPGLVTREQLEELERWQLSFLRRHRDRFADRIRRGMIRDGHGDLRLEHVFFGEDGDLDVIDAIEFDARYRWADVAADVAFLAMDLSRLGRVDLAERFLATYARAANDYDLYGVVDFYESYRACVRAKIAAGRPGGEAEARRELLLALTAQRRPLLSPVLVAVGGLIGVGKSTLANRLAARVGAPVIEADRTRKHLLGMRPTEHADVAAWSGPYDPRLSVEVYAEALRRADVVLASGRPAVVDASFRTAAARSAARELAIRHAAPFRFVECTAPPAICRERVRQRDRTSSASDGRAEVLDAFAARFEPVAELPPTEHLRIDTTGSLDAALDAVEREVATWPTRLVS
jgi:hypothetical protein